MAKPPPVPSTFQVKIPPQSVISTSMDLDPVSKKRKKSPIMTESMNTFQSEAAMRASRLERFQSQAAQEALKKSRNESISKRAREMFLLAGQEGNPDVIDWDEETIIWTCTNLEKSYLRITSAVDPSTVRPLYILKQSLEFLIEKWKKEGNYTYICDQLKSLRQDLTVQRIKNDFSVRVYETHARIAIEKVSFIIYFVTLSMIRGIWENIINAKDNYVIYTNLIYQVGLMNLWDIEYFI